MKYCPYCGASLLEDAAFCTECGKTIPIAAGSSQTPKKERKPSVKAKKRNPLFASKKAEPDTTPAVSGKSTDDGYDNYYDDVLPSDEGAGREKLDKSLVRRIVLVSVGALVVVALAIVLMQAI